MNQYKVTSGVKLIGIHGHAGAGKDTVADYLCESYYHTYAESFASPLKDAAASAFGVSRHMFDTQDGKATVLPFWNVSPRQIAQFMGTEMFRETLAKLMPDIGSDFWVKRMAGLLSNSLPDSQAVYNSEDVVVIPDVRFQNEYDFIVENNGIIIHLTRPGADGNIGIPGHASESSLNLHDQERTFPCVNDSDFTTLFDRIDSITLNTNIYS